MGLRNPNNTEQVTEFILMGFQLPRPLELLLFVVFLAVFLLTLAGNVTIIALVCLNQHLHTPMYLFLGNFSLVETLFVLSITPKMLVNLLSSDKAISILGCITQCYFYFSLGACESSLIAVMAFDRYVAICYPLRDAVIMNRQRCSTLMLGCWVGGFLALFGPMPFLLRLPFCGSNRIDHFFCDYAPIIKLSCSQNVLSLLVVETILSSVLLLSSLTVNGVSYLYIIATILRMRSSKGRQKTFSTCASHITVASVFFASSIFMYSLPSKGCSQEVQKAVAILTAVVTPLLNPFIYTLRNGKVKDVLKNCLKKWAWFQ
ncbi:olfactory receptor 6M1-like [Varanus komodoensis]|uniref:olfactory receptor 6M1-like n=1 Tax=Varanus komodoensis TaxID=61221 RepID=UPI001CF7A87B|nr:olfactory receptor 6M1-like [Varanus komodoensis]